MDVIVVYNNMKKLQIFQPNLDGFLLNHVELNPTEAQIKSGEYDKAKMSVHGMDITIENPKGSTRSGVDEDGKKWSSTMKSHYGYFDGTHDRIAEDIDVFVGDNTASTMIYVVDQINPSTGRFDESKVMLGYNSHEEAKNAYLENYDKDWKGFGNITPVHVDEFKKWLYDGGRQLLPFHKYLSTPKPIQ